MRTVVDENPKNLAVLDVFSKLIQNRIIFIDDEINEQLANEVIAQLLHLDAINNDPISIYINSPGGSVYNGLAIYDVSKLLKSPIITIGIGMAASMAAILMLMGSTRKGLKHCRFMMHDLSGGAQGTFNDIKVSYEEMESIREDINKIVTENTNIKNFKELTNDKWYNAEKALEAGIITEIL